MAEPALELPVTLRNMLGSIMCNNILSSWNISSNEHNAICVSIRFIQPDPAIAGSVDMLQPVYYRKQTPKQVRHNKGRTQAYQQRLQTTLVYRIIGEGSRPTFLKIRTQGPII